MRLWKPPLLPLLHSVQVPSKSSTVYRCGQIGASIGTGVDRVVLSEIPHHAGGWHLDGTELFDCIGSFRS